MQHKMQWKIILLASLLFGPFLTMSVWGQNPSPSQSADSKTESNPLSYGILIGATPSFRPQGSILREAAKIMLNDKDKDDEVFLVEFSHNQNIILMQDLTKNKAKLLEALETSPIVTGSPAIIDAVFVSADYLFKSKGNNRRVLILITDGLERNSVYKIDQLIEKLRVMNIQVFVIGLPENIKVSQGKKAYEEAVKLIKELTEQTGGQALFANDTSELNARAKELLNFLRK